MNADIFHNLQSAGCKNMGSNRIVMNVSTNNNLRQHQIQMYK